MSIRLAALLRAINVGGRVTTMADLRDLFEKFGVHEVSTYIQTGNVIFTANQGDRLKLQKDIDAYLHRALGYQVDVFLMTRAELAKASANNPFHPDQNQATHHCHLMFLSDRPTPARVEALMAMEGGEYRFAIRGSVLYYAYSKALVGKRRNISFEKILGVRGTARTWKVVDKIVDLMGP